MSFDCSRPLSVAFYMRCCSLLPGFALRDNDREMSLDWSCGELAEGLRCYRAEEFFLAHEHWESVWLVSQTPEKNFLQSLIQVAAAFHHLQRRNAIGAASLLQNALRRLEPFPDSFGGIAVAPLRDAIRESLQALHVQNPPARLPFPQIRQTPDDSGRTAPDPSPSPQ